MSIVKLKPDQPVNVNTTVPEAIEEPNKSIFTELLPESKLKSLLKYVEGYPWTINYYGQILNENNTLNNFDPSTPNLTQSYYKINELVLQVLSPLSSSYDNTTGITTISGSGLTPYKIKPNVGDVFIASIDTGEDAIFLINSVERKTFRKDTLYEVNYSLFSYTSQEPNFITTLENRVNDTYYFNKDTNYFNRDNLIKPTVKETIDRLKKYLYETKEFYFSTFPQKESGSILIPGTTDRLYDPLLLNFISKIVPYNDLVDTYFFRHNFNNNKYILQPSLFDVLLKRSVSSLNTINKRFKFTSVRELPNLARLGTLGHTGIDYILFPMDPDVSTDIDTLSYELSNPSDMSDPITTINYFVPNLLIQTESNNNIYTKNILHELFLNNYYIVSENFYTYLNDNTAYNSISYLELLIYRFIKGHAISKKDLVLAIENYLEFSRLHQLYMLPVLWLIIENNL